MNLFDYFKKKRILRENSNSYYNLYRNIHNLYENKKMDFLQLQRDNVEEQQQKRLLIEINLLAELLNREKVDEKTPSATLRAYPNTLLK